MNESYFHERIMQKVIVIFFLIGIIRSTRAFSQNDSALIDSLIDDIAAAQAKSNGEFYAGMFPSYRECGGAPHNYRPDNNVFFTAITAFTLKKLLPYLNA